MSRVITISREFGSGGREVGFRLAEKLGIPFYDKEIISMAAEDTNISEEVFHRHDEVIGKKERIDHDYVSVNPFSPLYEVPVSDQVFMAQSQIIKKLAQEGPCVIIGRCADYVLREQPGVTSVFIYADMNVRIACLMERRRITRDEAITLIKKTDKSRRNYYECYTGKRWGAGASYDVTLNSAELGLDTCVDLICSLYERKQEGAAKE